MYSVQINAVGSWSIYLGDKVVAYSFTEGMANRLCRLLNEEDGMEIEAEGVIEINGQGWRECSDDHNKIYYQGRICPLCENKFIVTESVKDILKEVSLLYRKIEDVTKDIV